MRAALLALLLLGCGGGREYRQAVPPIPATGGGAIQAPYSGPLIGPIPPGPQQQRVTLPRNRNSIKPTKAEDTLHAADEPKRTGEVYPYEVSAPFREFDGDLKGLPTRCAAIMTEAIRKSVPGIDKRDVDTTDGFCLDALLLQMCVAKETKGRTDHVAERARGEAWRLVNDSCDRHSDTSYVRRLVAAVRGVYAE